MDNPTPELIMGGQYGADYRDGLASAFDDTRTWVDPNGYRLSDRIWSARTTDRALIDSTLATAVARGLPAQTVANDLTAYLNPTYGNGNYAARRLARTEITRALGAGTLEAARRNPFSKGVRWALSGSHPRTDLCDPNADRDQFRLGKGVYPAMQAPRYPAHPNCLCTLVPVADRKQLDDNFEELLRQIKAERGPVAPPAPTAPKKPRAPRKPRQPKPQATPEPAPSSGVPQVTGKTAREKLADPKWMPDDADIDEAVALGRQQKQVALKAKEDFYNNVGDFQKYAGNDPEVKRLRDIAWDSSYRNYTYDEQKRAQAELIQRLRVVDKEWSELAYETFGKEFDKLEEAVNDAGQMMVRRVNKKINVTEEFGVKSRRKHWIDTYRDDQLNDSSMQFDLVNKSKGYNVNVDETISMYQKDKKRRLFNDATDAENFYNEFYSAVEDELHRTRSFGNEAIEYKKSRSSSSWQRNANTVRQWDQASKQFPDDWVKSINSLQKERPLYGEFTTRGGSFQSQLKDTGVMDGILDPRYAGQYDESKRVLKFGSTDFAYQGRTLVHEMGHAADDAIEGLGDVNQAFFRRRVGNNPLDKPFESNQGIRWTDDFRETYIGRDYDAYMTQYVYDYVDNRAGSGASFSESTISNKLQANRFFNSRQYGSRQFGRPGEGNPSSEITSTGVQSVFRTVYHQDMSGNSAFQHSAADILTDEDYFSHIMGILAII